MSGTVSTATHATGRSKLIGHLAMICFAMSIAGSFSLGHLAVQHIAPAALNAVRFAAGTLILGLVVVATTGGPPRLPQKPWRFLILGALMAFYFVTMFIALKITKPVATGAVFTLMPFLAAFFGYVFLRQMPRPVVIVALCIAAAGAIWVIFRGDVDRLMRFEVGAGEIIYFFGCIAHAAYAPLSRKFNMGEGMPVYTFWIVCATLLCLAIYGAPDLAATNWTELPAIAWIAIAYLGTIATALTFFLLLIGTMRLPASKVLAYGYLIPCFVILYEGLAGHGWPGAMIFAGTGIIVLALLVLALTPDR